MVAYYVARRGKHRFGPQQFLLDNILEGNPVGLDEIKDATFEDLLSWMLKRQPKDIPSANEALRTLICLSDDKIWKYCVKLENNSHLRQMMPY